MSKKKWRGTSAYTISIAKFLHKTWIKLYCKFWRLFGWTPYAISIYRRKDAKYGKIMYWDLVPSIDREIKLINELHAVDTVEDNYNIDPRPDDWLVQAFLNASKIEVPRKL